MWTINKIAELARARDTKMKELTREGERKIK